MAFYPDSIPIRCCRVCKENVYPDERVKYSTRSYAHVRCFLEKHGATGIKKLNKAQLDKLPMKALNDHGLLQVALERWRELKA